MKIGKRISLALFALLLVGVWATGALAKDEVRTVNDATKVLKEIMRIPEKSIPPALLRNAKAVAIFPGVIKGAFVVGGEHGVGVVSIHQYGHWSDPVFLTITAGSVGWQIGGESTDLILVFKTLKGVENLMKGRFTLGVDAAVAAGPVGRSAEASTDVMLKAEILSYSRTRGLFAGASLEGAALLVDDGSDAAYYGKSLLGGDIVAGKGGKKKAATRNLERTLMRYSR